MGGCCCCASRKVEFSDSPAFYRHSRLSEEHGPLPFHHARVSPRSTNLLVDTNLDTTIPDSYVPPAAPIPYETNVGDPSKNEVEAQTTCIEHVEGKHCGSTLGYASSGLKDFNVDSQNSNEIAASMEVKDELVKSGELKKSSEFNVPVILEEDDCSICLEEYDAENPKIVTTCDHHFHLSCILEWMERSDTCPLCYQGIVLASSIDTC